MIENVNATIHQENLLHQIRIISLFNGTYFLICSL